MNSFPAHGVHDRGLEFGRQFDQFRVSPGTTRPAQDRDLLRLVEHPGQPRDLFIGRTHGWRRRRKMQPRLLFNRIAQGDVSRDRDHCNPTPRERGLHRNLQHAGHLLGLRNQFAIVAALRKKMFGTSFLKVSAPDFVAGNLRSDREHRDPAAVAVIETVDQMQVARAAAPRAHRELLREMRFRARRKRGCLFVPHMDPLNLFLSAK